MSDIEKKILDNLAYFDDKEPDIGHRNRFVNKLTESGSNNKRKINFILVGKIAASLVILIAISFFIVNQTKNANSNNLYITQIELSDEILEMQAYYDQLSLTKLGGIDTIVSNEKEALRLKKIAQEKMDNLDANLAMIEKEYMKNPQCENLKQALINNKKKKVEVIDNIVEQASNAKRGYHVGTMFDKF